MAHQVQASSDRKMHQAPDTYVGAEESESALLSLEQVAVAVVETYGLEARQTSSYMSAGSMVT
jgi:hypothetical protein